MKKLKKPNYEKVWCNYRGLSSLEEIKQEAFNIFRDFLLDKVDQADTKNRLGKDSSCQYIDALKPHYFIDLLSIWRQDLDKYMMECGCLSQDILQKFKDKYDIDCVLEKGLCLPEGDKYKQVYQLFLPVHGYCDDLTTYEWDGVECLCNLEIYPFNKISIIDRTYNTITFGWDSPYPTVFITEIYEGVTLIAQGTTTNSEFTFENLIPNTLYRLVVKAINCAGTSQLEITAQTLPVYLTVQTTGAGGTTFGTPNPRMVTSETEQFIFNILVGSFDPLGDTMLYIDSVTISTESNPTPIPYNYTQTNQVHQYPTQGQVSITGITEDTTLTINFARLGVN